MYMTVMSAMRRHAAYTRPLATTKKNEKAIHHNKIIFFSRNF